MYLSDYGEHVIIGYGSKLGTNKHNISSKESQLVLIDDITKGILVESMTYVGVSHWRIKYYKHGEFITMRRKRFPRHLKDLIKEAEAVMWAKR